jgi:uncharacterized protein with GYD domain
MPTYLIQGSYTAESMAAMIHNPEDRSIVVRKLVESFGGKLEGFWLSLGEFDFVSIVNLPDTEAAAALAIAASAGGGVHNYRTVPLLSWTDGVKAFKKASGAHYQPPAKHIN